MTDPITSTLTITEVFPYTKEEAYSVGIAEPDTRWWLRLWYFLLRKSPPTKLVYYKILDVSEDGHTLTITKRI